LKEEKNLKKKEKKLGEREKEILAICTNIELLLLKFELSLFLLTVRFLKLLFVQNNKNYF